MTRFPIVACSRDAAESAADSGPNLTSS